MSLLVTSPGPQRSFGEWAARLAEPEVLWAHGASATGGGHRVIQTPLDLPYNNPKPTLQQP